ALLWVTTERKPSSSNSSHKSFYFCNYSCSYNLKETSTSVRSHLSLVWVKPGG
ncbi:hypothetical protein X975_19062, partial [Stegodyphus mimosarum]